jgi:glycosyltransferase involved in cell wall biosynthesis
LERPEWTRLSGDYDIFINTTDFDNHPVSVIEAMALGLPLVSTNVGGLPYLIENGRDGILVPPQDADAFVKAIEDLLQNPAKASRLAHEARRKVEAFDWALLKTEWLRLLSSAMRPAA